MFDGEESPATIELMLNKEISYFENHMSSMLEEFKN